MRVAITGGCGFIGSAVVRRLIENDFSVRIIDNLAAGSTHVLNEYNFHEIDTNHGKAWANLSFCKVDILNREKLFEATIGADAIIHLAANTGVFQSVEDPYFDCSVNVSGTLNTLEACRNNNVKKFIFASSGAPLGNNLPPLHEKLAPAPMSPYGASKLAGEGYCSAYFHSFNIQTVALRFGNVYGPGSELKTSVVAKFIKAALNNEQIEIYGTGQQTRDYIFVKDLVDAIFKSLLVKNIGGEIFQIATATATTVNEIYSIILHELEKKHLYISPALFSEMRVGDALQNFSNTDKAKSLLGWHATTDIQSGISQTIDYFIERGKW